MDTFNSIKDNVIANSNDVYQAIIAYLPTVLLATVVAVIGYVLARWARKLTLKISKTLKVDNLVKQLNLDDQLEDAGIKMKLSHLLANAVKWIVIIITLLVISGMFESLSVIQDFINNVLAVIGRIIVALFIFAISVYAARFAGAIAKAVANYIDLKNTKFVADIVKVIIYFFALLQILKVLEVTEVRAVILLIVQAAVYGFALALGIAFGLGGQERAKEMLEKIKK